MGNKADRPYGTFRTAPSPAVAAGSPARPPRSRLARVRAGLRGADRRQVGATVLLVGFALWLLASAANPAPRPLSQRQVQGLVQLALASATPRPNPAVAIYEKLRPAVVSIRSRLGTIDGPEAAGAGVVIDESGSILTSLHVVAGAVRIRVIFDGGQESLAGIVAQVPENDIAVIRAATPPLPLAPAVLGDPGALRIGEDVYAIGDPFGLARSLSAGVVSQLGRTISVPGRRQPLVNLIQFDAAVNPGSSGGPLVNGDGDVIGVVTGIPNTSLSGKDTFAGVGFAVRIDTAASAAGSPPY